MARKKTPEIHAESQKYDPTDPFGAHAKAYGEGKDGARTIDKPIHDVVESDFDSPFGTVVNSLNHIGNTMTRPFELTAQESKEAAAKAKIAAKAEKSAATAAKKDAAEKAKTEKAATAKAAAELVKDAKAVAKAERARAKAEAGTEVGGIMSALNEKVKSGTYVKGTFGQMRCNDEIAQALDGVPTASVVVVCLEALGLTENPYFHLNYGQQSMNLRNKLRGAHRKPQIDGEISLISRVMTAAKTHTPEPTASIA